MTDSSPGRPVAVLGLGAMGHSLAATQLEAGGSVTVWNRTPGRFGGLTERGAIEARTADEAVATDGPVVVCLYDHASVHETLDPLPDVLPGRTVVNLTTTTPDEARELAVWAEGHGITYLDGAIMATPPMIGASEAAIFYGGSCEAFEHHRDLLQTWATSTYEGEDAGMASLFDLAMLSGMYSMFAGFLHGAAMIQSAGVTAVEFAGRAAPFLAAMTASFGETAKVVDSGDDSAPLQSLDWTDLGSIIRASQERGVDPVPAEMVRGLVQQQIERGHGADDFDRIIESMRPGAERDHV